MGSSSLLHCFRSKRNSKLIPGDVTNPNETKYTLEYYLKMADAIVEHGCHSIGIKDMAGLLKPNAATLLIGALRAAHPDVVLHVHTHDSAGTAVATQLAAAAAGADMVDLAMDAMSGCTSQVRGVSSSFVSRRSKTGGLRFDENVERYNETMLIEGSSLCLRAVLPQLCLLTRSFSVLMWCIFRLRAMQPP